MERKKYIGRLLMKFIKSMDQKIYRIDKNNITGYIAHTVIIEVNQPWIFKSQDREVCFYDKGHYEMNYLPDNENWQVYALYDNNGKIIQWYFDITKKNAIDENGKPYCDDLFLDVILLPNGEIITLDEDELQDALENNIITKKDFDLAYKTKDKLINNGVLTVEYMETLCNDIFGFINRSELKIVS
jgi:predicted RNA-binding protein associated with RNAse of E/G family